MARLRRYNQVWWAAFLFNIGSGFLQNVLPGRDVYAWLHVLCAVLLITMRYRFHRQLAKIQKPR